MLSLVMHIVIYELGVCLMYKCRKVLFGLYISLNIICSVHSYSITFLFTNSKSLQFDVISSKESQISRQKRSELLTLMRKFKFYSLSYIHCHYHSRFFCSSFYQKEKQTCVMESHHLYLVCLSLYEQKKCRFF